MRKKKSVRFLCSLDNLVMRAALYVLFLLGVHKRALTAYLSSDQDATTVCMKTKYNGYVSCFMLLSASSFDLAKDRKTHVLSIIMIIDQID